MRIQKSNFNMNIVETLCAGAGIIPLSKNPSGEWMLLLGRERFLPQWKGSCRWSGFEGSRKQVETLQANALREFSEESLDAVLSREEIRQRIERKDYWIRVVLQITSERRPERYHATYVVRVPFNTHIPESFARERRSIDVIDQHARELQRSFPTFAIVEDAETDIGDVLFDGCKKSVSITRHIIRNQDNFKHEFLTRCPDSIDGASEDEDDDIDVSWTVHDSGNSETAHIPSTHPYYVRIRAWEAVRQQIEKCEHLTHSSVIARRGSVTSRIQEIHVLPDFLEKDQVRWWSVSDLRRVLDFRGFLSSDVFRPYFLPVLQTILHELAVSPPAESEEVTPFGAAESELCQSCLSP